MNIGIRILKSNHKEWLQLDVGEVLMVQFL